MKMDCNFFKFFLVFEKARESDYDLFSPSWNHLIFSSQCCKIILFKAVFNWMLKVILELLGFCIATLCDWLKNLAQFSQPIRGKTKTNHDLVSRVFPRLAPAICICLEF